MDETVSGEQMYSDTQFLLLAIAKSLPAGTRVGSIRDLIDRGEQAGKSMRNQVFFFFFFNLINFFFM